MRVRIYVDGSALRRYLSEVPCSAEWMAWALPREPAFLTSPLALTELRRAADVGGGSARAVAHDVGERLELVRFSDQALHQAAMVTAVLPPFASLHLGIALAHPDVTTIATYDATLAAVAVLYGLEVAGPGLRPGWWEDA